MTLATLAGRSTSPVPSPPRRVMSPFVSLALCAAALAACSTAAQSPGAPEIGAGSSATSPSTSVSSPTTRAAPDLGEDPVDDAFKKKADTACSTFFAYISNHQPPIQMANLFAIPAADLPAVGAYYDSLPTSHDLVRTMTALGTPAKGTASWAVLLEDFPKYEEAQAAAIAAAKTAEASAWTARATALEAARDAIFNHLSDAGFHGGKDGCRLLFSQSSSHGG